MSKRFTDTDKYKKAFMRGLPGPYKLLWDFLCCDCNHAGVWHKDFEIAQIYLGADMPVNETEALSLFNKDVERIRVYDGDQKWMILPFVGFQYGKLNPENRAHQAVLFSLDKAGIKPLQRPLQGRKDKEKEQEKVKEKESKFPFQEIWDKYPNRDGRKEAERHFTASVKTDQDWTAINRALQKYLSNLRSEPWKKPKNGSTWFGNWKDWIDWGPGDVTRSIAPDPEKIREAEDRMRAVHEREEKRRNLQAGAVA